MTSVCSVWEARRRQLRTVTSVAEYRGESAVRVAATQLGADHTRTQAVKIVAEWVEFFSAGPSPLTELHLVSRTPKRLFGALAGQTQLRSLSVKWGDYDDLSVLAGMRQLETLRLGGAASVRSVAPLGELGALRHLEIESLRDAHDLAPLGRLAGLVGLELGGAWASDRIAHIDSIAWLRELQQLEDLLLHTIVVDDLDYSPLFALQSLRAVRVMRARGMRPVHEELVERLPWSR